MSPQLNTVRNKCINLLMIWQMLNPALPSARILRSLRCLASLPGLAAVVQPKENKGTNAYMFFIPSILHRLSTSLQEWLGDVSVLLS